MIQVGERALLVRQRDGEYVLARSQWAGTDGAVAAVTTGTRPRAVAGGDWHPDGRATDFASVVATLDYLGTEALYLVGPTQTVVFLPLWFGLPLAGRMADPSAGALVAVDSVVDARRLRSRFRHLKGDLADALAAGTVPAVAVPLALSAWIDSRSGRRRYLVPPFAAPLGNRTADP